MTTFDDGDQIALQHPNPSLPLRERIGYLIYSWDDTTLADDILSEVERGAPGS